MKILIMCEGPNELKIVNLLLDNSKLKFTRDDLLDRRTIERVVFTYRKDLWKNKRFSLTQKGFILTFLLFYGII